MCAMCLRWVIVPNKYRVVVAKVAMEVDMMFTWFITSPQMN